MVFGNNDTNILNSVVEALIFIFLFKLFRFKLIFVIARY